MSTLASPTLGETETAALSSRFSPLSSGLVPSGISGGGAPSGGPVPGITALGPVESAARAREHALVLQSMSITHQVRFGGGGWFLLVRDIDYQRAAEAINQYESENRDWPPRERRERLFYAASPVALITFAALFAFFLVTGPVSSASHWFAEGRSVSHLVVDSQPWRAATALTLHADGAHILGNAISGTIFASMLQRRFGPGLALFSIVTAGTLGNYANAWYYFLKAQPHASIGASTAVFAAVGILAASQLVLSTRGLSTSVRGHLRFIAPVIGGLAILGSLGANPESDIRAHGFGFLAGLLVGSVVSMLQRRRGGLPHGGAKTQLAWGLVGLGLVLGSWQLALHA